MYLKNVILEPHYFPCINYFSLLYHAENIYFNVDLIFRKQSYKNRCYISAANKIIPLIIPVKKGKSKLSYKDVQIDYSTNWQKLHWSSIISAYNSSPFFLHYKDYYEKVFLDKVPGLLDLNLNIIRSTCRVLGMEKNFHRFSGTSEVETTDLTNQLHPKQKFDSITFSIKEYYQVFIENFGFLRNLSIMDLIFNEGPVAVEILKDTYPTSS